VDAEYTLTWVAPAQNLKLDGGAQVMAQVQVSKPDGGMMLPQQLPVSGDVPTQMLVRGSTGVYSGTVGPLQGSDGKKTLIAGWPDAGPTAELVLLLDRTAPTFQVQALNVPVYGGDGGFLEADPSAPSAVKKDDTVVLRVESTATDVAPGTVRLGLVTVDGGEAWDAGSGEACDGGAGFCRDYTLVIGPQRMDNFVDSVTATVTGEDDVGNSGRQVSQNVLTVTRWKWARNMTGSIGSSDVEGSPAILPGGDVLVPVNLSPLAGGGLYRVTPAGGVTRIASEGPIRASPAVGLGASSAGFIIFYVSTSSGLRALNATNGCGAGNANNVGSPAILDDGQTSVRAVGVVWAGNGPSLQAAGPSNCTAIGVDTGVSAMAFPGNVVTDGTDIWYPVGNGSVQRAPVVNLTPVSSLTGFGAGTIYGLSLFGTKLAGGGGGGGAGVGRLFVANKDGSNITGYNPARHVSGVAVGESGVLFAVTEEVNDTAVLRRFDSAGNVNAATSSFGSFPSSSIPGATTPVLGAGGFVYAVSNEGDVVAVDQFSMAVRWRRTLGLANAGQVVASATLDCNRTKPTSGTGVYYFVTTGGWLVAYVVDSPGLDTNAPWPKYQHDARNTGNLHASKACP
jgi:hypothetical protein